VIVEVLKRGEGHIDNDNTDDCDKHSDNHVIVRVWETMGGRGIAKLAVNDLPVKSVIRCNLLEYDESQKSQINLQTKSSLQHIVEFSFKPFEIISFKFSI